MRQLRAIAFVTAILASACFGALASVATYPVIRLHTDGGGSVSDHMKFFSYIQDAGVPVAVDGDCVSACTLVLKLPKWQVCITPRARLGFHLASTQLGPDPAITAMIQARFYPPVVQEWIKKHGPLTEAPVYMEGTEAIKLGVFRECGWREEWQRVLIGKVMP